MLYSTEAHMTRAPVAFIFFKRLGTARDVFARIRAAQPSRLYLIADGWRNEAERVKCEAVRAYVENAIDWPCELNKNYSDANLGCKNRIASGISWVFEQEEEAIILEDDCVPDPTFFRFCDELLERYRTEPRVMQITGGFIQHNNPRFNAEEKSYYFSQFAEISGFATWRRAWKLFDVNLTEWPKARAERILYRHLIGNIYLIPYITQWTIAKNRMSGRPSGCLRCCITMDFPLCQRATRLPTSGTMRIAPARERKIIL